MMSARKRSLSTEEEFESPEKISEEPRTPVDSPNTKKRRHSSLHSDTDQLTQLLDDENVPTNGKRTFSRRSSFDFASLSLQVVRPINPRPTTTTRMKTTETEKNLYFPFRSTTAKTMVKASRRILTIFFVFFFD